MTEIDRSKKEKKAKKVNEKKEKERQVFKDRHELAAKVSEWTFESYLFEIIKLELVRDEYGSTMTEIDRSGKKAKKKKRKIFKDRHDLGGKISEIGNIGVGNLSRRWKTR